MTTGMTEGPCYVCEGWGAHPDADGDMVSCEACDRTGVVEYLDVREVRPTPPLPPVDQGP